MLKECGMWWRVYRVDGDEHVDSFKAAKNRYPISPISNDIRFLAADQGGIEWGGRGGALSGDSLLSALNFRERANHLPQY